MITGADKEYLRKFVPLSELSNDNFNELVSKIMIEALPAGATLFSKGDWDHFSYYLLKGEVQIIDADGGRSALTAESQQSYYPLEHNQPRKKSINCKTDIQYFKVDNNLLDILLTWDQNKNYIVNEFGNDVNEVEIDDNDWMTQLLQLEIFHKIPAANIQAMFQKIESISVKKDEVIIKQGDTGDYYYIIHSGNCRVIRNATETGNKEIKIAELTPGSGFGEDALISDAPRNSTVIMNDDGILMRLAKKDFIVLLQKPIINSVNFGDAVSMVASGAVWIDVRCQSEHKNKNIPASINIPLFLLRLNASKLPAKRKYIIYCDTGSRSASATYILNERGYDAYLLEGGLMGNDNKEESAA